MEKEFFNLLIGVIDSWEAQSDMALGVKKTLF